MAAETKKESKRVRERRILTIAIGLPIVIALLIGGGPAIWKGIVTIFKVIVPNIWVVVVYLYVSIVAFCIGRITKR